VLFDGFYISLAVKTEP